MSSDGLLCYRPVSGVCGRSWILPFSDLSPCVPTNFSSAQQGRRGHRANDPVAHACVVCFEPKIVENRSRNCAAFVTDCGGAVVGMGDGDVKVEGGVERDVCGGAGW